VVSQVSDARPFGFAQGRLWGTPMLVVERTKDEMGFVVSQVSKARPPPPLVRN